MAGHIGGEIFNRAARKKVFDVTGGIPRLVNIVCDGALLAGYGRAKTKLGSDVVLEVARGLELPGVETTPRSTNGHASRGWRGWLGRLRQRE